MSCLCKALQVEQVVAGATSACSLLVLIVPISRNLEISSGNFHGPVYGVWLYPTYVSCVYNRTVLYIHSRIPGKERSQGMNMTTHVCCRRIVTLTRHDLRDLAPGHSQTLRAYRNMRHLIWLHSLRPR